MHTSESIDKISAALVLAHKEMLPLVKDSTNPHFRSKYADLAAVTEACYPALQSNGICVIQSIERQEEQGINVRTRLLHSSGQFIETECVIPPAGQDPQKYGSATTYGRRYGLQAAVGLAPIDDDGESAMNRKPSSQSNAAPAADDMVDKIVASFWAQVDVAGLEAKMTKAKGAGYGSNATVIAAYNEVKAKL